MEEEVAEVRAAAGDRGQVLLELLDVANAAINTIYMQGYSTEEVEQALQHCRDKNKERGYY